VAQLNIALTLPGEAALGTFEAGAVSALLVAVQSINRDDQSAVDLDIMTGASSGSLTAVLAAAALLTGGDPVEPLRRAWVSEASLDSLREGGLQAPLSLDSARTVGHAVLADMLLSAKGPAAQASPVKLEFAITCLRGFTYQLSQRHQPRPHSPVTATRYLDWARHEFGPGDLDGLTKKWSEALDSSIASASLPVAFPPALLDRSSELDEYERRGVMNLPEGAASPGRSLKLWYADGGLVDREPLGRCIRLARPPAGDAWASLASRLVLAIRPCPEDAPYSTDPEWSGGAAAPRWRAALGRALRVLVTHSTYEDLRRVEDTNNRIAWAEELYGALEPLLTRNRRAKSALAGVVQQIQEDRAADGDRNQEPPAGDVAGLLRQALNAATGLESKGRVNVEIVTARSSSDVSGAAVGFVAERLRATDFLVGYDAMLRWMNHGLERYGVDEAAANQANRAARERAAEIPGWVGEVPMRRRPPLRLSGELLRLGVRAARAGLTNPRARDRV
jgi:predicted acylesterase/phospholipase RssA